MKRLVLFLLVCLVASVPSTASASTIAYWRFDDVGVADIEQWGPIAAGNPLPDSDGQTVWRKAVHDYSGNGNHLTTWDYAWAGFNWTSDVRSATVPLTGAANALSIQNGGSYPAAMTWSEQSLPSGADIETMTPAAFTIEASFKAGTLSGYHTIVGRDDRYVATSNGDLAALYFQVVPGNAVAFKFTDVAGNWHELISDAGAVTTGQWYNMVGVSDGTTMSLYLDNELIRQINISGSPNTALALGSASGGDWESGTWSIGRGLYAGGHTDRWFGYIDEVRISDNALNPSEFLQVPVKAEDPVPADGSSVPPEYDPPNVYMILDYTPGVGAVTHTAYFSDVEQDVIDRDDDHCLGDVPPWPVYSVTAFVVGYDDPGIPEYARVPLVTGKTYYWCIDEFDGTTTHRGDVWSFTVMSEEAWGPNPADGEDLVSSDPTCTWRLGDPEVPIGWTSYAVSYDVYCGTNEAAVAAIATANTTAPQYKGNVLTATIDLAGLNPLTEYFWRVDTKLTKNGPPFNSVYTKGDVWSFTTGPAGIGAILREWWLGLGADDYVSTLVNFPRYPDDPNGSELLTIFEGPTNFMQDQTYGSRIHGWLYVVESGDYTFWIASDNQGQLWLSSDASPANVSMIADVSGGDNWAPVRGWSDPDVHPSAPIYLEGGRRYYISAIHKEGNGGDNVAVAWQGPDSGNIREVIPGNHLMPYVPVTAHSPDPADKWMDVPTNVTLSWSAGIDQSTGSPYTTQHVYVGGDPAAVANATTASPEYMVGGPTGPNEYGPLSLNYLEKVYWRIDGVSAETGTVHYPGPVWTFKAIYDPGVILPDIRLWLKFDGNALDSSLRGRDGTEMNGPTYSTGYDGQAIVLDGIDDYVDLPIGIDIASLTSSTFAAWVNFSNLGDAWQRIFDFGSGTATYLFLCPRTGADGPIRFAIKPPDDVEQIVDTTTYLSSDWHHIAVTIDAPSTTATVYLDGNVIGTNNAVTLTPSDVGYSTQNWIGRSQYVADGYLNGSIDDFRIYDVAKTATEIAEIMRIDLSWAWNPSPMHGAVDVARDVVLTWSPGDGATAHTIYFGEDPANMAKVAGPQVGTTYDPPGDLNLGTTYYWAVVESPGLEMGRTWKFTTAEYIVVDDMESYVPWTQSGDHIFEKWRDAFGDCTPGNGNNTGSTLTENADPVLGGIQSMKYEFDNDGTVYSPCTMNQEGSHLQYSRIEAQVATLPSGIGTNWTIGGVRALYVPFYGTAGNAVTENLWVQLKHGASYGNKVFYGAYEGESLADFNEPVWHDWYIDLADFGVALNNVTSIVVGIGNENGSGDHGSGTLYFDEIRLYAPMCMPQRAKPDADFDNSCQVDYPDIAILFDHWLAGYVPETAWSGVWQSADIGDVNEPGSFSNLGGGAYSMTAGGDDIWNQADSFHYAYQPISGDCQLTVRVTDIGGPSTNDWRKAGVMIRETLDANSPHAFMTITPAGGSGKAFQWRPAKGGDSSSWDGGTPVAPPTCVRIVRTGDTFRGLYYYDGEWFQQGSAVNIPMSENVYIGMALTSHDYANECTATFDRACSDEFLPTDLLDDKVINFLDYAVLMSQWLDKVLWP